MHSRLAPLFACLLSLLVWVAASPAHAGKGLENFTGREVRSADLKPFPKWTGVLSRYFDQKTLRDAPCGSARFNPCALNDWEKKVESLRGLPLRKQAEEVNAYLNKVKYVVDPINWNMPDYWSTPNEFLEIDGDCEDYAIAKFISLRALGVPNDKMRIMVVQDMNLGGIIHGILALDLDGETYILDNQIPTMIKASKIYHYKPIFSINETAWWRH